MKQLTCPVCGSEDVNIHTADHDNGIDADTGYHDIGDDSTFTCNTCGQSDTVDQLVSEER